MPGDFFPWWRKPAPGPTTPRPKAPSPVAASGELSQLQAELKVAQDGRRQVRQDLDMLVKAKRESDQVLAASQQKVALPPDRAIDAEVDLGTNEGGYLLRARLNVSLPGLQPKVTQTLVDAAHQLCPYSKATRGNIEVTINLV